MDGSTANSTCCTECHQHRSICSCDPPVNIYLVKYKLITDSGLHNSWCEGKLRCLAFDIYQAMSKVQVWLVSTHYLWLSDGGVVEQYRLPSGKRDVTIKSVELYAENVGEVLKAYPLPEIFEHSE